MLTDLPIFIAAAVFDGAAIAVWMAGGRLAPLGQLRG